MATSKKDASPAAKQSASKTATKAQKSVAFHQRSEVRPSPNAKSGKTRDCLACVLTQPNIFVAKSSVAKCAASVFG